MGHETGTINVRLERAEQNRDCLGQRRGIWRLSEGQAQTSAAHPHHVLPRPRLQSALRHPSANGQFVL